MISMCVHVDENNWSYQTLSKAIVIGDKWDIGAIISAGMRSG